MSGGYPWETGDPLLAADLNAAIAAASSAVAAGGPFLPLSGGTVGFLAVTGHAGFNGTAPVAKPTVSGAWAGNTAGKALCVALASYGLILDSTTA